MDLFATCCEPSNVAHGTQTLQFQSCARSEQHPLKQQQVTKNADAFFISDYAIGVCDGVSAVEYEGVDSSKLPRDLVYHLEKLLANRARDRREWRLERRNFLERTVQNGVCVSPGQKQGWDNFFAGGIVKSALQALAPTFVPQAEEAQESLQALRLELLLLDIGSQEDAREILESILGGGCADAWREHHQGTSSTSTSSTNECEQQQHAQASSSSSCSTTPIFHFTRAHGRYATSGVVQMTARGLKVLGAARNGLCKLYPDDAEFIREERAGVTQFLVRLLALLDCFFAERVSRRRAAEAASLEAAAKAGYSRVASPTGLLNFWPPALLSPASLLHSPGEEGSTSSRSRTVNGNGIGGISSTFPAFFSSGARLSGGPALLSSNVATLVPSSDTLDGSDPAHELNRTVFSPSMRTAEESSSSHEFASLRDEWSATEGLLTPTGLTPTGLTPTTELGQPVPLVPTESTSVPPESTSSTTAEDVDKTVDFFPAIRETASSPMKHVATTSSLKATKLSKKGVSVSEAETQSTSCEESISSSIKTGTSAATPSTSGGSAPKLGEIFLSVPSLGSPAARSPTTLLQMRSTVTASASTTTRSSSSPPWGPPRSGSPYLTRADIAEGKRILLDAAREYTDPRSALQMAFNRCRDLGSTTAMLLLLESDVLRPCNLGDCGYLLLRKEESPQSRRSPRECSVGGDRDANAPKKYEVVARSVSQLHAFNCPYQLTRMPDVPYDSIDFEWSQSHRAELADPIRVKEGDVLICGSDGLFDNVFESKILSIVSECCCSASSGITGPEDAAGGGGIEPLSEKKICQRLFNEAIACAYPTGHQTPFSMACSERWDRDMAGGKPDDTTVIVSVVRRKGSSGADEFTIF
ncbi:unnamed protein product [Amoebophrya sp. A25]|nr:unnamed protein product [Amoebophrya sp. A25]|eukprot:GSA25T00003096001.1